VLPCVTNVTNVTNVTSVTNVTDVTDAPATDVADAPDVRVPKEERELPPSFKRVLDIFNSSGLDVEVESVKPLSHYDEDCPF